MRILFGLPPGGCLSPGQQQRDVIIDTDPGVDDAFALLLAMRSPELNVLAVTVVAGNVPAPWDCPMRCAWSRLAAARKHRWRLGAPAPLTRRAVHAYYAHGTNGLGGVPFPEAKIKPVAEPATELIRRLVRERPGRVSIVTLGPLTNIALVLRADPELARMIPRIVMMGGSLSGGNTTPSAEFNIYFDPEAARVVFQSGIPLVMVGLDVTNKARLHEEHVKAMEAGGNPASEAAGKLGRSWMDRAKAHGPHRRLRHARSAGDGCVHRSVRRHAQEVLRGCRDGGRTHRRRDRGLGTSACAYLRAARRHSPIRSAIDDAPAQRGRSRRGRFAQILPPAASAGLPVIRRSKAPQEFLAETQRTQRKSKKQKSFQTILAVLCVLCVSARNVFKSRFPSLTLRARSYTSFAAATSSTANPSDLKIVTSQSLDAPCHVPAATSPTSATMWLAVNRPS